MGGVHEGDIIKGSGACGMGASDEGLNDATLQTNDSLLVPIYRIIAKNVTIYVLLT